MQTTKRCFENQECRSGAIFRVVHIESGARKMQGAMTMQERAHRQEYLVAFSATSQPHRSLYRQPRLLDFCVRYVDYIRCICSPL